MGAKEGKGEEKEKKVSDGGEKKKAGGGGAAEKKEEGPPKVVLKVDMHCEGCASKIKRSVKGFEGVESVTTDMSSNKLTVMGKVDPWKLRDRVEAKTKKKVEIVSPVNPPKKDTNGAKKPDGGGGGGGGGGDSKDQKKPDDKKTKEPAATTVVLKIRLHCDGCIQRIKKTILKIKGVQEVSVEAQKDLVTVKGILDVKSLPSYLKDKLNRSVEVVSAGGGGGGGGGGGEKKAGGGGGGEGGGEKKADGGGGGGEKKEKGGGGGDGEKKGKEGSGGDGGGGKKGEAAGPPAAPVAMEANKMEYYGPYGYRAEMLHAPQLFSDENPNACSVM